MVQKQKSVLIEDLGYADCSPVVPYKTKSNVEQPTKYPEPHKVQIVEQEAVNDVGDFSEHEAPKKGKGIRSSKGKSVALQEAPKKGKATRFLKGKAVAQPEAPKRGRATKSSKGKGVAMASATEKEDSDASLFDAFSFVDSEYGGDNIKKIAEENNFLQQWIRDHAPVEDTFWPYEDEERNEGEGGIVNEGEGGVVKEGECGVHNFDNLAGGDQPSQTGQGRDHPSHTSQNKTNLHKLVK
ncbi:unnamed protein product [Prunus armeniaca]